VQQHNVGVVDSFIWALWQISLFLTVKEFWRSVKFWPSNSKSNLARFLGHRVENKTNYTYLKQKLKQSSDKKWKKPRWHNLMSRRWTDNSLTKTNSLNGYCPTVTWMSQYRHVTQTNITLLQLYQRANNI